MAFPFVGEKRRGNDALRHGRIMMWSKREFVWADVGYQDASTARSVHTEEPFFRTFAHEGVAERASAIRTACS
jgi:hypothetical protein